ncbi:hypothetical protein L284_18490 [Novosphingobium lindaniclasticum LE124]|uniref:Uncharacterized protein n=1 Tax=Novosphingobium lindaniclasticum LE124 TaxID=1096930 RepID=T0IJQ3_9SPHN|nr:hypothetical protein L284_18490 [Novosphingobium lindaniclasticum LE124]
MERLPIFCSVLSNDVFPCDEIHIVPASTEDQRQPVDP